ncbi:MAG: hypothetical protein ACRDR6_27020 [Pseudonocardiaceae bacterium]
MTDPFAAITAVDGEAPHMRTAVSEAEASNEVAVRSLSAGNHATASPGVTQDIYHW